MHVRVTGDPAAEPFLGKWVGDAVGSQARFDMRDRKAEIGSGARRAVGGQRVTLHKDDGGTQAPEKLAQFTARVIMRRGQVRQRRQRSKLEIAAQSELCERSTDSILMLAAVDEHRSQI